MKAKNYKQVKDLKDIPNVGEAVKNDLRLIGIKKPDQLINVNGIDLYNKLNRITGEVHDPCMADTFLAIVDFMNGGSPKPWWKFTNTNSIK